MGGCEAGRVENESNASGNSRGSESVFVPGTMVRREMRNVEGRNISISPDGHLQQLGGEKHATQKAGTLDTACKIV